MYSKDVLIQAALAFAPYYPISSGMVLNRNINEREDKVISFMSMSLKLLLFLSR
jgi:hypothetical protein